MQAERRKMKMRVMEIIAYWCNVGGEERRISSPEKTEKQKKEKRKKKEKMKNGEILRKIKNSVSEM